MADTLRNATYLQNVLRDGQAAGSIVPATFRDLAVSILSTAVVTAAGTNQSTATALTARKNIVTTVPSGTGVILQQAAEQIVLNRGANDLLVYPASGCQIEQYGNNIAVVVPVNGTATFTTDSGNTTQVYVS